MSFTRASVIGALVFSLLLMPARAEDGLTVQGTLAIAKMTGACGILHSMMQFQENTKLQGGDEFVVRFWAVEAARLGLTTQELAEHCNKSVTAYDKLWKLAEPEK